MMRNTFELLLHPIADTKIENIIENGYVRKVMILGNDKYYITNNNSLFYLFSKTCIDKLGHPASNVLHYTCEWGIRFIGNSFNGTFKILNNNTVIAETVGEALGQFIFKEYGKKKYLYDPFLFNKCEERLTKYFPNYNDHGFWNAVLNNTKVTNITDDNLMQYFVQRINCGVFNIRYGRDSKIFTDTIKNYVESTTVLSESTQIMDNTFNSTIISGINHTNSIPQIFIQNITGTVINLINDTVSTIQNNIYEIVGAEHATVLPNAISVIDDAFNSTITNSATEISESIFTNDTTSWTEMGINLINNTIVRITHTTVNTTDHSQANMFDDSENDTSSVAPYQYIAIGVVAASMAVMSAGVAWYVKNKNLKKAKLKQYITEIESQRLVAEDVTSITKIESQRLVVEDITTENYHLHHNDCSLVALTGRSDAAPCEGLCSEGYVL